MLNKQWWIVTMAILVVYVILGAGRVLSTHPWNDEAWYSAPALSLIEHGHTGTPYLETAGRFYQGINEHTYWVTPLHIFVQVPWYKIFGFSLVTARAQAMMWGALAIVFWGVLVERLTSKPAAALGTMFFLACDYQFVSQAALARMDAMAAAFTALGVLSYLTLRERNLALAVLVSQSCVVACGLSHPNPGVPTFFTVAFLTLYYDRRRLQLRHIAIAALPYVLGAAGWAWYISPAPGDFRAQFFGNVTDHDRLGFRNPPKALITEVKRYAAMAGFEAGQNPLYRIKIGAILAYLAAAVFLWGNRRTRDDPALRPFLWLWLVYVVSTAFYDNTKEIKYGFSLVPWHDALLAIAVYYCWNAPKHVWRWAAAAASAVFVAVGVGGLLYTTYVKNDYRDIYLPATDFIARNARPEDVVFASTEWGFALGFDRNIVDDHVLGYNSGRSGDFVVMNLERQRELAANRRPEIAAFVRRKLQDYDKVYTNAGYAIYRRKQPSP